MDDQKTPPSDNPTPATPTTPPLDPQAAAEEEAILNQVKQLETEEQNEVHTDAEVIDKREEAGKVLEQEAQQLPATPTATSAQPVTPPATETPAPVETPAQPETPAPTEPPTETS